MHPAIETRHDEKRGCGWRKPRGLYLVCDGLARPCGKFPIPLEVCPCCSAGIKASRGWTWVNGTQLADGRQCSSHGTRECATCPVSKPMGRVGLIWIGEAFYPTPSDYAKESARLGVSRRISAVPKDFEVGKTWVWIAHRKAIVNPDGSYTAAVFQAFKPTHVEYVVEGNETDEEIDRLLKRGITPVRIEKVGETKELFA